MPSYSGHADSFMPVRILPDSVSALFPDSSTARSMRSLLRVARGWGGLERPFLNRLPLTESDSTVYLWARKTALDEFAMLHFLLNRSPHRGPWSTIGASLADAPEPFRDARGLAVRVCKEGTLRNRITTALMQEPAKSASGESGVSDGPVSGERLINLELSYERGRIEEFELPEAISSDMKLRVIPVSIAGDYFCRDILERTDMFVWAGKPIHPPATLADVAHFNQQCRIALQKQTPILASHLIALALFEYRLEHKTFRFEKIESRLHDLARQISRSDFPHDERLRIAAFRTSRMERFRRCSQRWFYPVDGKWFFHTEEYPDSEGHHLLGYLWFADQAVHVMYELGMNRHDLDNFIAGH
ncbi:MAG: hypothetical protein K8S54_14700 [Spirochaetia bacterium]|nr:hypothetical protein [Spirochaetia bacterium]